MLADEGDRQSRIALGALRHELSPPVFLLMISALAQAISDLADFRARAASGTCDAPSFSAVFTEAIDAASSCDSGAVAHPAANMTNARLKTVALM
ncbi:hypothetical protein [Nannocystis pusilla]|uniref:hypothetical protein n=1 Tax=Nannocystis pusilla TaxID=889268 RepID=UPI003B7C8393